MSPGPSFEDDKRLQENICILEPEAAGTVKAMADAQVKCMDSARRARVLQLANDAVYNSAVAANEVGVISEQGSTMFRLAAELEVGLTRTGAAEMTERGVEVQHRVAVESLTMTRLEAGELFGGGELSCATFGIRTVGDASVVPGSWKWRSSGCASAAGHSGPGSRVSPRAALQ